LFIVPWFQYEHHNARQPTENLRNANRGVALTRQLLAFSRESVYTPLLDSRYSKPRMATHLRAIHPNTQTLFISGYPRTHFDDMPSERDDLLQKPFRGDELVSRVRALLYDADDFSAA